MNDKKSPYLHPFYIAKSFDIILHCVFVIVQFKIFIAKLTKVFQNFGDETIGLKNAKEC